MREQKNLSATGKALVKKVEAITAGAALLAEKTNDWQIIKEYLSNRSSNIALTPMQQKKLERYQFVYNQLSSGKFLEKEVVTQITREFNVSQEIAYEDLADAKELYGFLFSINKVFELKLQLDINRLLINKAKEANDLRAAAAFEKNRIEMLKLVPELVDTPGQYFESHINEIMFDPGLIGAPDIDIRQVLIEINKRHGAAIDLDAIPEAEVITHEKK